MQYVQWQLENRSIQPVKTPAGMLNYRVGNDIPLFAWYVDSIPVDSERKMSALDAAGAMVVDLVPVIAIASSRQALNVTKPGYAWY